LTATVGGGARKKSSGAGAGGASFFAGSGGVPVNDRITLPWPSAISIVTFSAACFR
jgi:hypothetical protein